MKSLICICIEKIMHGILDYLLLRIFRLYVMEMMWIVLKLLLIIKLNL